MVVVVKWVFRSSIRIWCAETTETPREIAETALAHVSGEAVGLHIGRTDYLEQRRVLMEQWAKHVTSLSGLSIGTFGWDSCNARLPVNAHADFHLTNRNFETYRITVAAIAARMNPAYYASSDDNSLVSASRSAFHRSA